MVTVHHVDGRVGLSRFKTETKPPYEYVSAVMWTCEKRFGMEWSKSGGHDIKTTPGREPDSIEVNINLPLPVDYINISKTFLVSDLPKPGGYNIDEVIANLMGEDGG